MDFDQDANDNPNKVIVFQSNMSNINNGLQTEIGIPGSQISVGVNNTKSKLNQYIPYQTMNSTHTMTFQQKSYYQPFSESESQFDDEDVFESNQNVDDCQISTLPTLYEEFQNQLKIIQQKLEKMQIQENNKDINCIIQENDCQYKFFTKIPIEQNSENNKSPMDVIQSKTNKSKQKHKKNEFIIVEISLIQCIFDSQPCILFFLQNVTFYHKFKNLIALNENKTNTLSHVSHEIRTPLNCIIGMLKTAEDNKDYFFQNQLKPTLMSAQLLANLINDLLDQTQWDAGTFKLVIESFNLRQLIQNVIEQMKILTDAKDLELKYNIDELLENQPFIVSDQYRIRQILINLIGNAVKFTTEGHISVTAQMENNQNILIKVTDTGVGISQENQTKLFKAFGKIQNDQLNPQGVGLGLLISNKLAQQLSHNKKDGLQVESKPDVGTTFQFYIHNKINQDDYKSVRLSTRSIQLGNNVQASSKKKSMESNAFTNMSYKFTTKSEFSKSLYSRQQSHQKSYEQYLNRISEEKEFGATSNSKNQLDIQSNQNSKNLNIINKKMLLNKGITDEELFKINSNFNNIQQQTQENIIEINLQNIESMQELDQENNINDYSENVANAQSESQVGLPFQLKNQIDEDDFNKYQRKLTMENRDKIKQCECVKILIVDDFPFNIKALQNIILQKHKVECDSALSGKKAIDKVESKLKNKCCQFYKIIFMDVEMPLMNGIETTKKIKEILKKYQHDSKSTLADEQANNSTIIVGLTGLQYNKNEGEEENFGMYKVLVKPISTPLLEQLLIQNKIIQK